ncbi:MAG: DUF3857 domain-containing protein [Stygiobacter sp.]|nr:MAG: DUF3857 domain-containing protein [Stygiobacter sp.]
MLKGKTNPFIVFILLFVSISSSYSQSLRAKWGEVLLSDLQMTTLQQDTSANALILSDFGESYFNNELDLVYERHLRVKIFNSKGYKWGTHSFVLYTEKNTETLEKIEGITYNLDESGYISKTELKPADVFKERIDDSRTRYRFTMPLLKPGCIIDLKYKISSTSLWFIHDWTFQHDEPVRWSEYIVKSPRNIMYSGIIFGYEPYFVHENTEVNQYFDSPASGYLGSDSHIYICTQIRMAVKNLPALRDEPYITTIDDYYNKVNMQLKAYSLAGTGVKEVLSTWGNLVNELVDNEQFGERIDDTGEVEEKLLEMTKGCVTNEEKVKAIYNWVSQKIVWDGEYRVFAANDVDDVMKLSKGSSAEIVFLFLSMLKSAGIESDPVIISTRSNGKIKDTYPIISQFNSVLARVKVNSEYMIIDPTDPARPLDLLSPDVLNTTGLVVQEDSIKWVKIISSKENKSDAIVELDLKDDGSFTGSIVKNYSDYASVAARNMLKNTKTVEVAKKDFDSDEAGFTVDSVTVINKDNINLPLTLKSKISSSTYAQVNGDIIYLNPHLIDVYKQNPFKAKSRKFNIDYAFRRNFNTSIIIKIPKGYVLKDTIVNKKIRGANGVLKFTRTFTADSQTVKIDYSFSINSTEIKPSYYSEVQSFYERMISAEAEQLVFTRKQKEVQPTNSPTNADRSVKNEKDDKLTRKKK